MAFTITVELSGVPKWFDWRVPVWRMERQQGQRKEWIRKRLLDPSAFKTVSIQYGSSIVVAQNVYRRLSSHIQVATGCPTNKSDGF
jgi:hypothetical protein